MTTVTSIDYIAENTELQPSMFRYSENFNLLIECIFKPYVDQQEDFLWLKDNILSIDDAELWHLDFLGALVGQSRLLVSFNTEPYFGFENSYQSDTLGTVSDPDVGGYWNTFGQFNTSTSRRLTDDEYRRIIKARIIYMFSNCITNDLVEVVNLITNTTTCVVSKPRHGLVEIQADDSDGLLAYFIDRVDLTDNILPIVAGVTVTLKE